MRQCFKDRIKMLICRFFGHKKGVVWSFNGTNAICMRCGVLYKEKGK